MIIKFFVYFVHPFFYCFWWNHVTNSTVKVSYWFFNFNWTQACCQVFLIVFLRNFRKSISCIVFNRVDSVDSFSNPSHLFFIAEQFQPDCQRYNTIVLIDDSKRRLETIAAATKFLTIDEDKNSPPIGHGELKWHNGQTKTSWGGKRRKFKKKTVFELNLKSNGCAFVYFWIEDSFTIQLLFIIFFSRL